VIVAIFPGNITVEGDAKVEQGPSYDHVVVDANEAGHNEHAPTNA
jgi:hypothetical protein